VGTEIPALRVTTTNVQLFRFSSVTWNAHRIHYDQAYAKTEGYQDVVVQSHLHAAFLYECLQSWFGPELTVKIKRFGWRNRAIGLCGSTLVCRGEVTGDTESESGRMLEIALEERDEDNTLCVSGWATIETPRALHGTKSEETLNVNLSRSVR
jgi:acyl dehydratase